MEFDWAEWGTPLMVFGGAIAAGIAGLLATRLSEDKEVARSGADNDLQQAHQAALQALKDLELDKDKLDPAVYAQERDALIHRGAAAMRVLDDAEAGVSDDVPDDVQTLAQILGEVRKSRGDAAVDQALEMAGFRPRPAPQQAMAPEWKGALTAFLVMGMVGLLVFFAQSDEVVRREGASMTGNQDLGSEMGGEMGGVPPWKEMAAGLEKELAADPQNISIANELTQMYLSAGDPGKAMEYSRTAFEIDANDPDARTYKAVLAAMVGMTDRALAGLEDVLKTHPEHPKALTYYGLILLEQGRAADAVPLLERAVAVQPNVAPLQQALDKARMLAGGGAPPPPATAPAPAAAGELVLAGTLYLDPGAKVPTGSEILFVSVRAPGGGPPLAALRLPPGPFPLDFRITTADAISMGGAPRPFPATMLLSARIDSDGNAMSKAEGEPQVTVPDAAKGTADLRLTLK